MAERFRFIPPLVGKALVIGLLIVLLLVPLAQVESLVGERVEMRQTAAMRVAESWGGAQTTAGVLLAIPVETTRVVVDQTAAGRETQRTEVERNVLYVLPDTLKISASVDPGYRPVGLYRDAGVHRQRADLRRVREPRLRPTTAGKAGPRSEME